MPASHLAAFGGNIADPTGRRHCSGRRDGIVRLRTWQRRVCTRWGLCVLTVISQRLRWKLDQVVQDPVERQQHLHGMCLSVSPLMPGHHADRSSAHSRRRGTSSGTVIVSLGCGCAATVVWRWWGAHLAAEQVLMRSRYTKRKRAARRRQLHRSKVRDNYSCIVVSWPILRCHDGPSNLRDEPQACCK
jgi:hypothetical protein